MTDVLLKALAEYGIREIQGPSHNQDVVSYFHEIGHEWVDDDETAWCAAFVGAMLKREGYEHTGKLNARSYLEVGWTPKTPEPGDVVIFWRSSPDSWKGHVGFYISEDDNYIYVLGGNQGNMVQISPYPKNRLLGYRRMVRL